MATGVKSVASIFRIARSSHGSAAFTVDTQTSLIDEDLFLKGLIVRWRRQKGMSYQDEEGEYEAALQDFARMDDRGRM